MDITLLFVVVLVLGCLLSYAVGYTKAMKSAFKDLDRWEESWIRLGRIQAETDAINKENERLEKILGKR